MPTSHSPQVREAAEANNDDGEDPDARRAPPAALAEVAADDAEPMLDVPRGMARPLSMNWNGLVWERARRRRERVSNLANSNANTNTKGTRIYNISTKLN